MRRPPLLEHIVWIAVLSLLAYDLYRTVRNFGRRRRGLTGAAVRSPFAHLLAAAVLVVVFAGLMAAGFSTLYTGVGIGLGALYALAAAHHARRPPEDG